MEDNFAVSELMDQAIDILHNDYDPEVDSFFVVVTKDGKDQTTAFNGNQAIIGELNVKSVTGFIVQAIIALCRSLTMHPFVFINRFIVGHFVDHERAVLNHLAAQQANRMEVDAQTTDKALVAELVQDNQDQEEPQKFFFVATPGMDVEN